MLYVGVTSTLEQRVQQHKEERFVHSFTARYHLHKLVYFERFSTIPVAIAREKPQILTYEYKGGIPRVSGNA